MVTTTLDDGGRISRREARAGAAKVHVGRIGAPERVAPLSATAAGPSRRTARLRTQRSRHQVQTGSSSRCVAPHLAP
jgi:hypothetical protein